MAGVLVRTEIDLSPDRVWEVVRDLGGHVEWMEDAVAIRFLPGPTVGVGAAFDCDTKIGPIALTDRMEVTEWREREAIGVRHTGVVTGVGRFTLVATPDGRTVFTWDEQLRFPWWLGGRLGEVPGGWILRRVWRRNLVNLKRLVEQRG
jgi:hypothetical protein